MASTNVLITGGNSGLGQGLVKQFLAQPNHVSTPSSGQGPRCRELRGPG